jgi:hypothetical protein
MGIPNVEPVLTFFGKELKSNPLIAIILALGLLCSLLGYIVFWQNNRISDLQNEKLQLSTTLLREQIRTDQKMDIIESELKKTTDALRAVEQVANGKRK